MKEASKMTPEFELDEKVLQALDAVYAAPSQQMTKQVQVKLRRTLMAAKGKIVYYGYAPRTRVGPLFVAVNDRGLVALDFGLSEQEFVARVSQRTKATLVRSDDAAAEAMKQVKEYLDGRRTRFDLPLDMSTMSEFQRTVLKIALKIPRGKYLTYGEVAKAIGKPQASRAVGQALGHNPVPIVIPCHRVLGSDGSLHGYSGGGGVRTKAWLLQLEGASVPGSSE
jgi:methylated-DNA-[protein]-cysteine S-methyltransferase